MATTVSAFLLDLSASLEYVADDKLSKAIGLALEARNLQDKLRRAAKLAGFAETKEIQDADSRFLINKLRDLAYDVEDAIDGYAHEAAARRASASKSILYWMRMFRDGSEYQKLKHRMKSLSQKMIDITRSPLVKNVPENDPSSSPRSGGDSNSNSVLNDSTQDGYMVGSVGQNLVEDVVRELTRDNTTTNVSDVIAIVGLGGVGKTTLARKIYHDERTASTFSVRLWVCVSRNFTDVGLLSSIISAAGGSPGRVQTKAQLQRTLAATISRKRFLLVLDDVWSGGIYNDLLEGALDSAADGSRILITARSKLVATKMGAQQQHIHPVELLSKKDALSLLYRVALGDGADHENPNPELRPVAESIVQSCKSLPLAIRIMGGILRAKQQSAEAWKTVHDSGRSSLKEIPEGDEGVMRSIGLAYLNLPPHQKQCFLYCCSLFPAGSLVRRRTVTELWISEGLVRKNEEQRPAHIVADSYYRELVSCNLLQPHNNDDIEECTVNSLVQSFAQFLTKEEILAGDLKQMERFSTGIRRLSITNRKLTAIPEEVGRLTSLRTFLLSGNPLGDHGLAQLFRKLKLLRVLDLSETAVEHIPETLGDLRFIRHLNLSKTRIRMLPDSLKFLRNLALLDLKDCSFLHSLPEGIQNLYNLQYLDLQGTALEKFPQDLQNLERLRLLHGFVVNKAESCRSEQTGWPLAQLKRMNNLRSLQLLNVERATQDEAKEILVNKNDLNELQLCCGISTRENHQESTTATEHIEKILGHLCPPENVESLEIRGYNGRSSPDWLSGRQNGQGRLERLDGHDRQGSGRQNEQGSGCQDGQDTLEHSGRQDDQGSGCQDGQGTTERSGHQDGQRSGRQGGQGTLVHAAHLAHLQRLVIAECKSIECLTDLHRLTELRILIIEKCRKLQELQLGGEGPINMEELHLMDMPELCSLSIPNGTELQVLRVIKLVRCPKITMLSSDLQHAPKLACVEIRGAGSLEAIESIPALDELVIQDAPQLKKILGVGHINLLTVIGCKVLTTVEPAAATRRLSFSHIHLEDGEMVKLPQWLKNHSSGLRSLRIVGGEELLDNCYFHGDFLTILEIDTVQAYLQDGTPFFSKSSGSNTPRLHPRRQCETSTIPGAGGAFSIDISSSSSSSSSSLGVPSPSHADLVLVSIAQDTEAGKFPKHMITKLKYEMILLLLVVIILIFIALLKIRDPYVQDSWDEPVDMEDLLVATSVIILMIFLVVYFMLVGSASTAIRICSLVVRGMLVGTHRIVTRFNKNWIVARFGKIVDIFRKTVEDLKAEGASLIILYYSCIITPSLALVEFLTISEEVKAFVSFIFLSALVFNGLSVALIVLRGNRRSRT